MNRTLRTRLEKIEVKESGSGTPIIVINAKWNETDAEAVRAAFGGLPPAGFEIRMREEPMTHEEWKRRVNPPGTVDPLSPERIRRWAFYVNTGQREVRRIRVSDRPVP